MVQAAEAMRCPDAILHAAAMSYLGKTAAVFEGTTLHMVDIDEQELMAEAKADVEFRSMLVAADVHPTDGQLSRVEALSVEVRVLDLVDQRLDARG